MDILKLIKDWEANNPNLKLPVYSPLFGEGTVISSENGIKVSTSSGAIYAFNGFGCYNAIGSCILFPSKDETDWSNFDTTSSLCPFKEGQILTNGVDLCLVGKVNITSFTAVCMYDTIGERLTTTSTEILKWKTFSESTTPNVLVEALLSKGYTIEEGSIKFDAVLLQLREIKETLNRNSTTNSQAEILSKLEGLKVQISSLHSSMSHHHHKDPEETPAKVGPVEKYVWPAATIIAVIASCFILYKLII